MEKLLLAIALLFVLVQPAPAVEVSGGFGRCQSDTVTVCDAEDGVIFHFAISDRWVVGDELDIELRADHYSHIEKADFVRNKKGSGQIEAITINLVYKW